MRERETLKPQANEINELQVRRRQLITRTQREREVKERGNKKVEYAEEEEERGGRVRGDGEDRTEEAK